MKIIKKIEEEYKSGLEKNLQVSKKNKLMSYPIYG